MKSAPSENEQYVTASNRITGVVVMLVGLAGLIDIVVEWRTSGGLLVATLIGVLMVLAYIGLVRPAVTLTPGGLRVRNHLRDHEIPWNQVTEVDVTDVLRITTPGTRVRCPGVQLVMRDLRKQRVGGRKLPEDSSISRADFVVSRIENHVDRYGPTATGEIVSRWATPELSVVGALVAVALVTWLFR